MIEVFNHSATDVNGALLISDRTSNEIIDLCEMYHYRLTVPVILEMVQKKYSVESMVFASFILGQLTAIKENNLFNQNLLSCQREN